jgi:hypothetical protein
MLSEALIVSLVGKYTVYFAIEAAHERTVYRHFVTVGDVIEYWP